MNNNLFKIDESEKTRILEMHQSATSRHYLGEQVASATTTSASTTPTTNEYVNDPDIVNINTEISKLNGIVSKFKSPFNLKSYGLNGVNRSGISMLQLVKYKIDASGRPTLAGRIFEINLGQSNIGNFNSGREFANEGLNRIDTSEAQSVMTKIVNDIAMFSGKFSPGDKISVWEANTKIINRNQQTK
jgi:hypothetical protein